MPDPKLVVSIDIGATKTVVAAFQDGSVTQLDRFSTDQDPQKHVENVVRTVRDAELPTAPIAVGIGCPGPLDPETGTILEPPNLPGWWGYPMAPTISDALGIPVRIENDANVGALGEAVFGSGKDHPSTFYLTLSTGIGAGFVQNGRIWGGHRAMAGEVWGLDPGVFYGRFTGETILELASGPGLIRSAARRIKFRHDSTLDPESLDTHTLLAAADKGEPVAVETLEAGRNAIAGVLITAILTFAPASIVLAGGLCTESRWFVDPIRERVREWVTVSQLKDVPIYRAELWDSAVLYGAGQMMLQP